jgi:demethylmenaquinone methyltransferase/2-methoxy-6-polyprenyl-1,4-benzoquinol methylase
MPDPRLVRSMFGRIAGRYDLLNRLLSAGIDRSWRARTVGAAGDLRGRVVVDACCGTGDLSLEFARAGADVIGIDFTPEMLFLALPKARSRRLRVAFVHGDALRLPLRSGSADVVSVAFGVRNLADPDAGLRELTRVLKPGGRLLILECSPPPAGWLGALYRFYFLRVLPAVGGWISGDPEAYGYLPRTVVAWPPPAEFQRRMETAGLSHCGFERLTHGVASLHWGTRGVGAVMS